MKIQFLFPSDYFNCKQVDESFSKQVDALQQIGFETAVISLENLGSGTSKIFPVPDLGSKLIYRGWMIAPDEYSLLVNAIGNNGADVWISSDEYLATHYLPNWYPLLQDLTPETHFFSVNDDLESELYRLGWSEFFIKDYVKSLKTSIGSIVREPATIRTVIAEMQKYRGVIEGGICVRQVEDFIAATEQRYFVVNGKPFAALLETEIPDIVVECARRIDSKFFSVDVVERSDGCQRVIEIGDGQVSDLVGWTAERFAMLWVQ
jgi:hypothetical protein